jgi:hypothetical protein
MGSVHADSIGDIVESTGIGSVLRNNNEIGNDVGTGIVLYDEAITGNGRMLIEFLDDEELSLTEHTQVYIDEVYYDPNPSLSKMSLRMMQGTARFASGNGQRIKKSNIDIRTPTAQIAIRGTDFTTTIDELGRSLIVLLPDRFGDSSGEITVINEGGEIVLDKAFQATMVSSLDSPPTPAVTITNLTVNQIDNMFIVAPPPAVEQAVQEAAQDDNNDDQGMLDVDFLEFNELEKDYDDYANDPDYDARYSSIDIDFLDADFLVDMLDVVEELIKTTKDLGDRQSSSAGSSEFNIKGASLGKNADSQYNVFIEDGGLVFYREVEGKIRLVFQPGSSVRLDTRVPTYEGVITVNGGDEIFIYINQSN